MSRSTEPLGRSGSTSRQSPLMVRSMTSGSAALPLSVRHLARYCWPSSMERSMVLFLADLALLLGGMPAPEGTLRALSVSSMAAPP